MKRVFVRSLLLLLLPFVVGSVALGGGPPAARSAVNDDRNLEDPGLLVPLEEGLVHAEILGVASQDFVAQFAADTLYIPYLSLCDFLRIPSSISADNDTLNGEFPAGTPFTISRRADMASRNGIRSSFPSSAVRMVGGELFIEQRFFFQFLGLQSNFRLSKLTLTITADQRLPVVQWSQNRQRYASLGDDEGMPGEEAAITVQRSLIGSPIIDWTYGNNLKLASGRSSASFHVGGAFMFGELEVEGLAAMRHEVGEKPTVSLGSWNWRYQAPESPVLKQIRIGRMPVAETSLYALDLSNVPLMPRGGFAEQSITGQTHPDWTIELYEGTRLVDVTRADSLGYYSFNVAVGYGTVDRTLRFVGTYGEILTESRRIQLDGRLIPAGEVDYTLRLGTDRFDSLPLMAGVGRLEVGVTDRLTLGAETTVRPTALRLFDRDSLSSSAFATLWLGESSSLGLRYRPESSLLSAEFYSITPSNLMVRAGLDSVSLKERTFTSTLAANIPVGQVSFGGNGRLRRVVDGYTVSAAPQISGYVAGINWVALTEFGMPLSSKHDAELPDSIFSQRSIRSTLRILATPLRGLLLGLDGTYDHLARQLVGCQVSTYLRIANGVGVSLGYAIPGLEWKHGTVTAQLELGFAPARVFAFVNRDAGATEMTGTLLAQGSVVVSGRGASFSPDFSLGKSTVIVRAFRDDNGNGERDGGEQDLPAPEARLRQGRMEMNGEDGAFTMLPANILWTLDVDRYAYVADGLYPSRYHYSIFTSPSTVMTIDIPCVPGFDLSGRVVVGDSTAQGGAHLNGLRVQLASSANGALYDGEIFSDGTILFTGVSAGDYRLVFDPSQLASRHLAFTADPGTIHLDPGTDHLPLIRLSRVPR